VARKECNQVGNMIACREAAIHHDSKKQLFAVGPKTCIKWESKSDESIRSCEVRQIGDAAFCQITFNTCLCYNP